MQILNKDQLMTLSDHDLKKMILNLRSRIKDSESKDSKAQKALAKELQTYYCYVYRELEHRGLV